MTTGPRVVLDNPKFGAWLKATFNMNTAEEALTRITEIDALAEYVIVDGQVHQIPADCYVDLFAEPEK